ncbi:MAG TPA: chromosome partitioning protein ParB [Firmicutes bacterium]|nr:chromosome partitioning protein ParB [Bacillota bacterium]HWR56091.1 ParB/RepB/Spo0J family partition protein [Negativicutes bacterium]
MSKKALGRGVQAIFQSMPGLDAQKDENVVEITVSDIYPNPYQPRKSFDQEKLDELANSIQQYGVIQPVVVRRTAKGYELVAGERRWRASQIVGLKVIPVVVRDYSDSEMMEIALIENLQRENLNPIEEGSSYRRLIEDFGLTQEEVAKKLGRSRSLIANTIRLLQLPPQIQDYVSRGTLTMGHAKALLALPNAQMQCEAANRVIEEDLNVRDIEDIVRKACEKPQKTVKKVVNREAALVDAEERLKCFFGTQVKIKPGKLKGKIEIEYYSQEDLERILEVAETQKSPEGTSKSRVIMV